MAKAVVEVKDPSVNCSVLTPATAPPVPMTVGQKAELVCPIQGTSLTSASAVKFQNEDASQPYVIQFIGDPVVKGESLSQTITSYDVGGHDLSKVSLTIDGKKIDVASFKLDVKSVLPPPAQGQQGTPTPFPIYDPEKVPAPWWWWALWIGFISIFLIFFIWQLVKWVKERRRIKEAIPEKELSPQELFLSRVRKLESRGLHQKGEYKAFALELTSILKTSIGSHFKFAAEDMTSEELNDVLERRYRVFFNTSGLALKVLLSDLDQIKFAKVETDGNKCASLLDSALAVGRGLFGSGGPQ